eukprot:TRINITY_DN6939_c0_g2_i1.p1 TRINITY_DN6939_c0_g2~~TRINITY_DN6939_c0_g2_i1.p1  ORF type:complete len:328 (-),score=43.90 TRINITY_DN6939_c0_g2_i1:49-1032(-)
MISFRSFLGRLASPSVAKKAMPLQPRVPLATFESVRSTVDQSASAFPMMSRSFHAGATMTSAPWTGTRRMWCAIPQNGGHATARSFSTSTRSGGSRLHSFGRSSKGGKASGSGGGTGSKGTGGREVVLFQGVEKNKRMVFRVLGTLGVLQIATFSVGVKQNIDDFLASFEVDNDGKRRWGSIMFGLLYMVLCPLFVFGLWRYTTSYVRKISLIRNKKSIAVSTYRFITASEKITVIPTTLVRCKPHKRDVAEVTGRGVMFPFWQEGDRYSMIIDPEGKLPNLPLLQRVMNGEDLTQAGAAKQNKMRHGFAQSSRTSPEQEERLNKPR